MIRVLLGEGETRGTWLDAWQLTGREPFAHPDYVEAFAGQGEQAMALLWTAQGDAQVLLPAIRRPVPPDLADAVGGLAHGASDLVSPYGYGGPYASGTPNWRGFYRDLLSWMNGESVVSAFIRAALSPAPPQYRDLRGYQAVLLNDNVTVDLTRSEDAQWLHYDHKVRKSVKKAMRVGVHVDVQTGFRSLSSFVAVLHETLRRRGASAAYFFEEGFFQAIAEGLPDGIIVAEALDSNGSVVSSELVLQSSDSLYSYMGGTRECALRSGANDLLKHAVINYGREAGVHQYVLGGGHVRGDGIFRYKRSFDREGVQPFFGLHLKGNPDAYDALCVAHQDLRQMEGQSGAANVYFPAYRG